MNLPKVSSFIIASCLLIICFSGFGQNVYQGSAPYCGENGGLIINEVSNGPTGTDQEYIELLVIGDPDDPTAPVDLEGYIIDDNNIDAPGNGTTDGHIELGFCYSSVPVGSIILIYNVNDPNPALPPDDPIDNNGDLVYILPSNSNCLNNCSSEPSAANAEYCPCSTPGNSSGFQALYNNAGDIIQVRDGCGNLQHALLTGGVSTTSYVNTNPTLVNVSPGNMDGVVIYFNHSIDNNWLDLGNFAETLVSNGAETPGAANGPANQTFINDLQAGVLNCSGTIGNCTSVEGGLLDMPSDVTVNDFPIDLCEGEDINAFQAIWPFPYEEPDNSFFNYEYAYILTEGQPPLNVLDYNTTGDFDFSGLPVGEYYVWGISYYNTSGTPDLLGFLADPCVMSIADIYNLGNCGYECNIFLDLAGNGPFGSNSLIRINAGPGTPTDPMLQNICSNVASNYDLTSLISTINNGTGTQVIFYDGDPDNGGTVISNPSNVDLSSINDLWILYGTSCQIAFDLQDPTIVTAPTAFPLNDTPKICGVGGNQAYVDLTFYNDSINGNTGYTVNWYEFPDLSTPIGDPTSYYITGNTFVLATVENNGCESDSVLIFLNMIIPPSIFTGQQLVDCGGTPPSFFDLTSLHDDLWPVPGTDFYWFEDINGTISINNPSNYQSSGGTIYVAAGKEICYSDTVAVELIIGSSDFGDFNLACDAGGSISCYGETICDNDGIAGETRCIYINGSTTNLDSVRIININGNGTDTSIFQSPGGCLSYFMPGNDTSKFILDAVWANGEVCPDTSGLGDTLINIVITQPNIDPFNPNPIILPCNTTSVQLPTISGTDLPPSPQFYTSSGGAGSTFPPGSTWNINGDTVIYAFAGTASCFDEEILVIEIENGPQLDPITDFSSCSPFTLPPLTGMDLTGNGAFYPSLDFSGPGWQEGESINLTPGSYTIYGVDGAPPCQDTVSFELTILAGPDFSLSDQTVCENELVLVDTLADPSNPNLNYTYYEALPVEPSNEISGPISFTNSTTIYVLGVDGSNCSSIDSFIINVNPSPNLPNISNSGPYCVGDDIELEFNGSSGGIQFFWTGPNGFNSNNENPVIQNAGLNNAGEYQLYIIENSCSSPVATTDVIIDEIPSAPVVTDPLNVCEGSPLTLQSNSGNNTDVNWSGPNGFAATGESVVVTDSATISQEGIYEVYAATNGCISDTTQFEVIVNDLPDIQILQIDSIQCNGDDSASLQVTVGNPEPPLEYDWSDDQYDGQDFPNNMPAGTYNLTVTDNNSCSSESSISISQPPLLSINCTAQNNESAPGAEDGTAEVQITGGTPPFKLVYENSSGDQDSLVNLGEGVSQLDGLASGTYMVSVIDDNGCTQNCQFIINSAGCALNITNIIQTSPILCYGDSSAGASVIVEGGNGNYGFLWINNGDSISTDSTIDQIPSGIYTIEVTHLGSPNCKSVSDILIQQPDELITACQIINTPTDSNSQDGIFNLDIAGGTSPFNIQINSPTSVIDTIISSNTLFLDSLNVGDYSVLVRDQNGCTSACDFEMTIETCDLVVRLDSIKDLDCYGDSTGYISLSIDNAFGPVQITWSDSTIPQNSSVVSDIPAGEYTVYVNDSLCSDSLVINITEPAPFVLTGCQVLDSASGRNYNDGVLNLSLEGGMSPFIVEWSGPLNGRDTFDVDSINIRDLLPGIYSITAIDQNGCIQSCSTEVPSKECEITIQLDTAYFTSCPSDSSLNIEVSSNGFNQNTIFIWSFDSLYRASSITNLPAGTYDIVILDTISGCSDTIIVSRESGDPLSLQCRIENTVSGPNISDGEIQVNIEEGASPYSIEIQGPDSSFTIQSSISSNLFSNLQAGQYTIFVTDRLGCTAECALELDSNNCTMALELTYDPLICSGDSTNVELSVLNGNPPFEIDWSQDEFDGLTEAWVETAGSYEILVSDANGCEEIVSFSIDTISSSYSSIDTSLCKGQTIEIGSETFSLDNPSAEIILPSAASNGCDSIVRITISSKSINTDFNVLEPSCPEQLIGAVQINQISGTPPYDLIVNGNVVGSYTSLPARLQSFNPGQYTMIIRDSDQCEDSIEFTIEEILPESPNINAITTITEGDSVLLSYAYDGTIIDIMWSPSNILSCDTCEVTYAAPTSSQSITLTIIDSNNCMVEDEIFINVVEDNSSIYIPNTFSPNADGINDYFTVYGQTNMANISQMRIFDRWGNQLMERQNIPIGIEESGWDGTVNSEIVAPGVYVYQITITFRDGSSRTYSGDVYVNP